MNELRYKVQSLEVLLQHYIRRDSQDFVDATNITLEIAKQKFERSMEEHRIAASKVLETRQQLAIASKELALQPYRKQIAKLKKLEAEIDGM